MAKLFRNQRRQKLKGNKVWSYLRYAIGEIVLVVIGILVAVTINNSNAKRQQSAVLEGILNQISKDLAQDTTIFGYTIRHYETLESYYEQVLFDSLDREGLEACQTCPGLITSFSQVNTEAKGYRLLQTYIDQSDANQDSLVNQVGHFYTIFNSNIASINQLIEDAVMSTLKHWRDHYPWFAGLMNRQFEASLWDYMESNPDFKNRVAYHHMLVYKNYLPVLREYQKLASQIMQMIDESQEHN